MSLINDALRRALQARRTPTQPADGPPLTPAEVPPPARWPVAAVPLLLMGVLLVAVWFLQQGLQPARQSGQSAPPAGVAARELPADKLGGPELGPDGSGAETAVVGPAVPAVDLANGVQSPPPTDAVAGPAGGPTNLDSTGQATASVATLTMPAPTNPPPPKLKAIFYRPSDPWAMIHSKTVRIGDRYGQARVIAITPDSVILVSDGQTNVLTFEH